MALSVLASERTSDTTTSLKVPLVICNCKWSIKDVCKISIHINNGLSYSTYVYPNIISANDVPKFGKLEIVIKTVIIKLIGIFSIDRTCLQQEYFTAVRQLIDDPAAVDSGIYNVVQRGEVRIAHIHI